MQISRALFAAAILMAVLITQAAASDKFSVYVYDKSGNSVADASVTVYEGEDKIDSGYTDSQGIFTTWLNGDIRYRIIADKSGQSGEWEGFPDRNSYTIRVDMR